jgi:hypothetical protein
MAKMTIRLRCDPNTGKKDIIVSLQSDPDALPLEHEKLHKQLVERLLDGGLLKPAEVGQVIVEREQEPNSIAEQVHEQPQLPRESQRQER